MCTFCFYPSLSPTSLRRSVLQPLKCCPSSALHLSWMPSRCLPPTQSFQMLLHASLSRQPCITRLEPWITYVTTYDSHLIPRQLTLRAFKVPSVLQFYSDQVFLLSFFTSLHLHSQSKSLKDQTLPLSGGTFCAIATPGTRWQTQRGFADARFPDPSPSYSCLQ